MTRHIMAVTSTRADYGLLRPVLRELNNNRERSRLTLVVTGSHLVERFGKTISEIKKDDFEIVAEIDIILAQDSARATIKSYGLMALGMADVIAKHKPDIMLLLGDRYEILGAASAATIAQVPIAHIHGGEITRGAIDDSIRHAITKMSHLHFATTPEYRDRIIQMGEQPSTVLWSGAPGVETARNLRVLDKNTLSEFVGIDLKPPFLLATYHPVTLTTEDKHLALEAMLSAIDSAQPGSLVMTYPNFDSENASIIQLIESYCSTRGWSTVVKSLGHTRYLSAVAHADLVIGNSSSGIIEAPALGTPTVNIGSRQEGRVRPASVIDCSNEEADIFNAIQAALEKPFVARAALRKTPYYKENCSQTIANRLLEAPLTEILRKNFHSVNT